MKCNLNSFHHVKNNYKLKFIKELQKTKENSKLQGIIYIIFSILFFILIVYLELFSEFEINKDWFVKIPSYLILFDIILVIQWTMFSTYKRNIN